MECLVPDNSSFQTRTSSHQDTMWLRSSRSYAGDASGLATGCNEAVMSADDLAQNSRLVDTHFSEIGTASLNSGGHQVKPDDPVNIEKIAQLARFYAAGTPPAEEFRAIKEWIGIVSNEPPDKNNSAHLAQKEQQTAQEIRLHKTTHELQTAGGTFNRRTEIVWPKSDFSAGLRALESSIRMSACLKGLKDDRLMRARALMRARISHTVLVFFAGLVGLTLGWQSHREEAQEVVRRWVSSVDHFLSVSTWKPSPASATSSMWRREAVAPEVAAPRHSAEHFGAIQWSEQNIRSRTSLRPLHSRVKRTQVPETRLTTIEGWTLREVTNGAAVLEGPNGTWTAKRGDTVPGVGRVESIVLRGKRWIVATSSGLISTP